LNKVTIGEVAIDLSLETRDAHHVEQLLFVLKHEGYHVNLVPAFRPGDW